MKMPVKLGWSRYTRLSNGQRNKILTIWTQPWHLYLRARLYYWITGPIRPIVKLRWVGELAYRLYGRRFPENDIRSMPLDIIITMNRHSYFQRGRTRLGDVPISNEQYKAIRGLDG